MGRRTVSGERVEGPLVRCAGGLATAVLLLLVILWAGRPGSLSGNDHIHPTWHRRNPLIGLHSAGSWPGSESPRKVSPTCLRLRAGCWLGHLCPQRVAFCAAGWPELSSVGSQGNTRVKWKLLGLLGLSALPLHPPSHILLAEASHRAETSNKGRENRPRPLMGGAAGWGRIHRDHICRQLAQMGGGWTGRGLKTTPWGLTKPLRR